MRLSIRGGSATSVTIVTRHRFCHRKWAEASPKVAGGRAKSELRKRQRIHGVAGGDEELLGRMFDAAVAAAHPSTCLPPHLPDRRLTAGSSSWPPERPRGSMTARPSASISTSTGRSRPPQRHRRGPHRLWRGDARRGDGGGRATRSRTPPASAAARALPSLAGATANDLVLVLISGGGSANWIAPAGGLTLPEKQQITRRCCAPARPSARSTRCASTSRLIKGGRLRARGPSRPAGDAGDLRRAARRPLDDRLRSDGSRPHDHGRRARHRREVPARLPPSAAALLADDAARRRPSPATPPSRGPSSSSWRGRRRHWKPPRPWPRRRDTSCIVLGADLEGEARRWRRSRRSGRWSCAARAAAPRSSPAASSP